MLTGHSLESSPSFALLSTLTRGIGSIRVWFRYSRLTTHDSRLTTPHTPLQYMYQPYIFIHMKTTLNIDDDLLEEARRLTGVREKTALVREGLQALIARESARRLKALGGTEKQLKKIPRRRSG